MSTTVGSAPHGLATNDGMAKAHRNIAGDKMFSHLDRIVGDHAPITADIFLTNYCNNRCPYCTYRRWEMDRGAYAMKASEFIAYAERLLELGVLGFILTGGGEPTINPDFEHIVAWLEKNRIHYGMNSNFNILKRCCPDYLKVSLDGWDEDSYEASRGVRCYHQVRRNIIEYAGWKTANGHKTTIGIQMVATQPEDVARFYKANRDLPVDYIVFRPMESTGGGYYLDEARRSMAHRITQTILGIAETDSRVTLNFKWSLLGEQEKNCIANWAQIALNELGEVMYCCHKPYEIVGHVLDEDILEKKAKAHTNMSMCDVPCRMTGPNMTVAHMLQKRPDAHFI